MAIPKTQRVDVLNIGLIILSLFLAYLIPYRLFLVAYAVLGPLHYLTEINWLHGKQYFAGEQRWLGWGAGLVALVVAPKFFYAPMANHNALPGWLAAASETVNYYSNGAIFLALAAGLALVVAKKWAWRLAFVGLAIVLAVLLNTVPFYVLLIGLMLPTVIHVYGFTLLFMAYGTLRSNSRWGYVAIGLMLAVPVVIALSNPSIGPMPPGVQKVFADSNFHVVNAKVAQFMGWASGASFDFYGSLNLKLQVFIAFAYLYHYLNWFSKTTVIGWHKGLTRPRTITIVGLWLAMVAVFAYNYQLGFLLALFFSYLHVFMEFPLNIVSIREIGRALGSRFSGSHKSA